VSLSNRTKQIVRERANFSCEYCGVSEQNAGGELTIDHFRPQAEGGGDELENLVYCCSRCNLYKSDFWVEPPHGLWNPRLELSVTHFWQTESGNLLALTEKGELAIRILHLNRPQLIAYRNQQSLINEERQLVAEHEITIEVLYNLGEEQREIIRNQQALLNEQSQLLKLLVKMPK
jgi:hypothetical protein